MNCMSTSATLLQAEDALMPGGEELRQSGSRSARGTILPNLMNHRSFLTLAPPSNDLGQTSVANEIEVLPNLMDSHLSWRSNGPPGPSGQLGSGGIRQAMGNHSRGTVESNPLSSNSLEPTMGSTILP